VSISNPNQNRPCVLVAVEDSLARELIAQMLHLAGFSALTAATGERALLQLREHRSAIDWLIASNALPGLVDAPILRDEFATIHPDRAAVLLAAAASHFRPCGPTLPSAAEVVGQLQALARDHAPARLALEAESAQALAA